MEVSNEIDVRTRRTPHRTVARTRCCSLLQKPLPVRTSWPSGRTARRGRTPGYAQAEKIRAWIHAMLIYANTA
jgi:hypothetical protein